MRKFLLLILLTATLSISEDEAIRERFHHLYFQGDYEDAHRLLPDAYHGEPDRQVWDERIHAWEDIPGCPVHLTATPAIRGAALLHTGRFEEAQECFGEDWLSWFSRAELAVWEGRTTEARESAQKALNLQPENPDLVYFAANLATSREQTIAYYNRYLDLPGIDPYRRSVVEYAIEFMKKTWDIPLNVPEIVSGFEEIESEFEKGELSIRGTLNGNKKVRLLLDTGASGMTLKDNDWQPQITSDVMRVGIGAKQTFRSTQMVLHDFEAGRYRLKNPVVGVSSHMRLDGMDGIVGSVLFSNHHVLVPLRSGRNFTIFTCEQPDALSCLDAASGYSEKTTVPFYLINRLMILKGRIRNSPDDMDILLDTGAQRSILSAAAARRYTRINLPLSKEAGKKSGLSGVGGHTDQVLIAENVEIEVGALKKGFNQLMALNLAGSSGAMNLELDLILGRDFLQGYTLLIDYRNSRVTFLK